MQTWIITLLALVLVACGTKEPVPEKKVETQSPLTSSSDSLGGRFKATLGDAVYDVEVECMAIDHDYFSFLSDKNDVADSNGDGMVISGMQVGQNLILTIINQDNSWSAPSLAEWNKSSSGATGSGQLYLESDSSLHGVVFEVTCP